MNPDYEAAKAALKANQDEQARLRGVLEADPNDSAAQTALQEAEDGEAALQTARDGLYDQIKPLLLAQGGDEYYIKQGLEYTAYENWNSAKNNLEAAQGVL